MEPRSREMPSIARLVIYSAVVGLIAFLLLRHAGQWIHLGPYF